MTSRHPNDPNKGNLKVMQCVKCGDRHTVDISELTKEILLEWVGWTAPILFDDDKETWTTEKWIDEFLKAREWRQKRESTPENTSAN